MVDEFADERAEVIIGTNRVLSMEERILLSGRAYMRRNSPLRLSELIHRYYLGMNVHPFDERLPINQWNNYE